MTRLRAATRGIAAASVLAVLAVACSSTDPEVAGEPAAPDAATTISVTSSDGVTTTTEVEVIETDVTDSVPATTVALSTPEVVVRPMQPGARRIKYEVGPIPVKSGQNNIAFSLPGIPKPDFDGFVTRIDPNLRLEDGSIPAVDVIHLHHGVWVNISGQGMSGRGRGEIFFAAGEEKTITLIPDGYGYPVQGGDVWLLNYMIHNLWPEETDVWVTYELDVIPADDPEAVGIVSARPIWNDVEAGHIYPVFDVFRGEGTDGVFVYPDDRPEAYGDWKRNEWTVDRDGVLLSTAGHLHPGGLQTDMWLTRAGATAPAAQAKEGHPDTAHLFTSEAVYYEPAGAVSWDVSMTATTEPWRVAVKAGDVLSINATYDSARASWYESMGIMVAWMADTQAPGEAPAPDPFVTAVDLPGELTHGHLPENDNHGGDPAPEYLDLLTLPDGPIATDIPIADYMYARGDMLNGDSVPTVAQGEGITFENLDAPLGNGLWHTITACQAPCNQSTGIAYPLADGEIDFDSGQLGDAGPPTAGRLTWTTPADLPTGTYTYFCRIHPFMRGGFRVVEG
jgi:plastocyanin